MRIILRLTNPKGGDFMSYKNKFYNPILVAVTLATIFGTGLAVAETPLEGAWVVTSVTDADGNTNDNPQPALYVFTATHYSTMIALGEESRTRYEGDNLTDGEKVGAYDTFIANSCRYEVDGNKLKTRAFVAKDPNYMGDWPENESIYEFERDGEKLTIKNITFGGFTSTLRQVEGSPNPW